MRHSLCFDRITHGGANNKKKNPMWVSLPLSSLSLSLAALSRSFSIHFSSVSSSFLSENNNNNRKGKKITYNFIETTMITTEPCTVVYCICMLFFFVVLQVIKKCKQVIKEHLKAIDPTVVYPFLLLFALLAGSSL